VETYFLLVEACITLTHNEAEGAWSSQIPEETRKVCIGWHESHKLTKVAYKQNHRFQKYI
jgi:hypothetical protein